MSLHSVDGIGVAGLGRSTDGYSVPAVLFLWVPFANVTSLISPAGFIVEVLCFQHILVVTPRYVLWWKIVFFWIKPGERSDRRISGCDPGRS
jgi:hypothetical protein